MNRVECNGLRSRVDLRLRVRVRNVSLQRQVARDRSGVRGVVADRRRELLECVQRRRRRAHDHLNRVLHEFARRQLCGVRADAGRRGRGSPCERRAREVGLEREARVGAVGRAVAQVTHRDLCAVDLVGAPAGDVDVAVRVQGAVVVDVQLLPRIRPVGDREARVPVRVSCDERLVEPCAPELDVHVARGLEVDRDALLGGRLAEAAWPGSTFTLMISDVPGDDPSLVASGPTIPDESKAFQALEILEKYDLRVPQSVLEHLKSNSKEDEVVQFNGTHSIIASSQTTLEAAASYAKNQGINVTVLGDDIEGEGQGRGNSGVFFQNKYEAYHIDL